MLLWGRNGIDVVIGGIGGTPRLVDGLVKID